MAVAAILQAASYNYYVRDLFFTDLPNGIAAAMNGPRVTVDSATQFDQLWEAVAHAQAFISGQSMGMMGLVNRGVLWVFAGLDLVAIGVCFFIWYVSRILMAVAITIGPFLIPLYLFRGTREYVNQWIGKLVNLVVLQLGTSILIRFVILTLSDTMKNLDEGQVSAGGNASVDEMMMNFAGVTGIFALAAMAMLVLPIFLTIGSGSAGAVSAVSGMAMKAGSVVGGAATGASAATVRGAATLGRRLGQYTGSR
jgi:type IV secretory pathway VirB6-like protein